LKSNTYSYSECVLIASVIQHVMCIRSIVLSFFGLSDFIMFYPHDLINGTIAGRILLNIKMFRLSVQIYLKYFSFQEELRKVLSNVCVGVHENYR
jgi:hypothetical protein